MVATEFAISLLGEKVKLPSSIEFALSGIPMNEPMRRNGMARLVHVFVRDVLGLKDISESEVIETKTQKYAVSRLQDLYDCRVCVNDITQVFLRGLMKPRYINEELGLFAFGVHDVAEDEEITYTLEMIEQLKNEESLE